MKPRSRYRLLAVFAVVGGLLCYGAWTGVSEENPNNQGGVACAVLGLFILACVYATTGTHWLISKLKRPTSDGISPKDRREG